MYAYHIFLTFIHICLWHFGPSKRKQKHTYYYQIAGWSTWALGTAQHSTYQILIRIVCLQDNYLINTNWLEYGMYKFVQVAVFAWIIVHKVRDSRATTIFITERWIDKMAPCSFQVPYFIHAILLCTHRKDLISLLPTPCGLI